MRVSDIGVVYGSPAAPNRRRGEDRRKEGIRHSQYKNNFTPDGHYWEERRSGRDRRDRRQAERRVGGVKIW